MSDNILQTVQHVIQDVIAPDVRELKANQVALEKQIASLEKHIDVRFEAADRKADARFDALLAAISESRAQAELTNMRVIA
jgi:septal ring factor EnvC (AmiA/AmiB activator)